MNKLNDQKGKQKYTKGKAQKVVMLLFFLNGFIMLVNRQLLCYRMVISISAISIHHLKSLYILMMIRSV